MLVLSGFALAPAGVWAQADFSEVIGTLSRERSLGEAGVAIVKRYTPDDVDARLLYARAKAAFDELIDQLLADLAQGNDPSISAAFRAKVQHAVDCRVAFSERVSAVVRRVPTGAKAVLPNLLALGEGPGELVKDLVGSGITVWREWRAASGERRTQLAKRLEAQRWKAFADVAAAE